jgi:methionyl-tRNA formyltransferase
MINVHGEILPRFQGAASVIWAIHEGIPETGFTIHEVEKTIDTGRILYQEKFPLEFADDLETTVQRNIVEIGRRVPSALAKVVADYPRCYAEGSIQEGGTSFTTPTLHQFLHMRRQFERLRSEAFELAS